MIELICIAFIGAGVLLCLIRMVKGPTAADRAMALDTVTTVSTALIVVLAYFLQRYIYLDVALVYALLVFIGSVVIARFLERGI
ncbi:MAG: Na(+)/H(+) antiporter subunit F [Chitinispirillaceae bacterium]|nr:Na(+)/H(+) antiporter subunit F [Chitinispirillaceae bacterium]